MSFVTMILCALIVLARMIYQLNLINEENLSSNCTVGANSYSFDVPSLCVCLNKFILQRFQSSDVEY